ncbi:bifunctional uridylyltransferase/uridylyl-removing protein GlnD [Gallibacterium salpingitidis]|uniref:bifunctional uridylyltransferase/uridylyl-removing protein GlnD n=1 Tax=Gallibacterium salpingitidis TaxID=505341 RepID=UPI0026707902|nr:bifunctional uridylyltransferase/uridylyl-removing protein GlnD [Gallibacterium salpingitidis]WKT00685.1 bifunctional uridylyltransferase/uridylyl-removing protein GlnD [Gallibacterium salpingitidis]
MQTQFTLPVLDEKLLNPVDIRKIFSDLKEQELQEFSKDIDIYQLICRRSHLYDQLLLALWRHFKFDQQTTLSLIAVGGYGREEMFPLSDLDFLILSSEPLTEQLEQQIAEFVQFLWDCHFEVGHSIRTLAQCIEEGKNDISIATNLLESRFLAGNQTLFEQLSRQIYQDDFWSMKDFFVAKQAEKNERYQRYHNTAYNLEPDIKYSPGGLRDLHLLYWIAWRHFKAKNLTDLLDFGFIYPEEYQALLDCQTFLFKLRYALHLVIKRYDNRLLFERQLKISSMLGYQGEGNQAVEKMMKAYFRNSQQIMQLSEVLMQDYQEQFLSPHTTKIIEKIEISPAFYLVNNSIQLQCHDTFQTAPETMVELFLQLCHYPQSYIHSSTLRQLRLALLNQQHYLSENTQARDYFIQIFNQPQAITRAIVPMHRYGVLKAYLREWKHIVGLMQFDLFHAYTVDEHTVRLLRKLESFASAECAELHPLCHQIFPTLTKKPQLFLAALFHDIAKGRSGDHAELGAIDMFDFAIQHGFSEQDAEFMAWLVLSHLQMSIVAQRRDIHDPDEIRRFANIVNNKMRLDYLVCLTVADICATNETLWNSWKRTLLATLYRYTKQQLEQGITVPLDYSIQILQNRIKALDLMQPMLEKYQIKVNDVNKLWQRCPEEYFLRNTSKQLAWHAEHLCQIEDLSNEVIVLVSSRFSRGATEIFIYCADQPQLFNKVVRTLDAKNLSIHDAQIITAESGEVFDSFIVTEADGSALRKPRRDEISQVLKAVLKGEKKVPTATARRSSKLQHFNVPLEVRFLNIEKEEQTELELITKDRAGLLAMISDIFTEQQLTLANAKITTNGEKAEDFFILTNLKGVALTTEERRLLQLKLEAGLQ